MPVKTISISSIWEASSNKSFRPGAALGAALGATSGLGTDAVMGALDSDFVESVTSDMRPGMTAIIVEADKKSTKPVDDAVAHAGGQIRRQAA